MPDPARHLQLVDPATGEIVSHCPQCAEKDDQIAGLQKDLSAWRARYANAIRDKEQEAKAHSLWPLATELFKTWKQACRHPNSRWTVDRFWLLEPLLSKYGEETCRRAIAGAAFDPHVYRRKNGTVKRCDEWARVFESADRLEDFANKAPRNWPELIPS